MIIKKYEYRIYLIFLSIIIMNNSDIHLLFINNLFLDLLTFLIKVVFVITLTIKPYLMLLLYKFALLKATRFD
jgi:hypothetical protein